MFPLIKCDSRVSYAGISALRYQHMPTASHMLRWDCSQFRNNADICLLCIISAELYVIEKRACRSCLQLYAIELLVFTTQDVRTGKHCRMQRYGNLYNRAERTQFGSDGAAHIYLWSIVEPYFVLYSSTRISRDQARSLTQHLQPSIDVETGRIT